MAVVNFYGIALRNPRRVRANELDQRIPDHEHKTTVLEFPSAFPGGSIFFGSGVRGGSSAQLICARW